MLTPNEFYARLRDERDRVLDSVCDMPNPTSMGYEQALNNLSHLLHLINTERYFFAPGASAEPTLAETSAPGGSDITGDEPTPEAEPEEPPAEEVTPEPAPEEPETEMPKYSKVQVRQILGTAQTDHPALDLPAVLRSMGAKMLSDVPEEKYPELLDRLNAAIKELG